MAQLEARRYEAIHAAGECPGYGEAACEGEAHGAGAEKRCSTRKPILPRGTRSYTGPENCDSTTLNHACDVRAPFLRECARRAPLFEVEHHASALGPEPTDASSPRECAVSSTSGSEPAP
jgi:hypothetical protein